jgi:hypothetical protein
MSEIQASTLMAEGLGLLDHGLADMSGRTIVSADEVVDLLLDLRMILAIAELRVTESGAAAESLAPAAAPAAASESRARPVSSWRRKVR